MDDPIIKSALCATAHRRMDRAGIGIWPPITAPKINRRHIDGPYLKALDGTMVWLSPWERLLTKLGVWDAWDVEKRHFPPTDLDVLFPAQPTSGPGA
jgi:hypothetical protein